MKGQLFNQIQLKAPRKNVFDLSHERKQSMKFGYLTPILVEETVPGDKWRCKSEHLLRFAPTLAPAMARFNVYVHYFYVPMRIIWNNYEKFFTGGEDGKTFPSMPQLTINDTYAGYFGEGGLADYMGIPVAPASGITDPLNISALPFRAYQQIYNDYYRDQNLTPAVAFSKEDNVDSVANLVTMRLRAYEKDYFTGALPDTQRGDDVILPNDITYKDVAKIKNVNGYPSAKGDVMYNANGEIVDADPGIASTIENVENVGITVNDLRTSVRLQEWLERSMRGGARYVEHVLSFFGVKPNDGRLMRAEYIGGSKTPVVISEVLATFNNQDTDGGTMYGHAVSLGSQAGFTKFCPEHGYIIGLMSVLPRSEYCSQGVNKMWLHGDRFEFFYPQFAHLGEQPILSKEIFHDYTATYQDNTGVFGYVPRYSEYKYRSSSVHGSFRSTLDYWHMGRKFLNRPVLSQAFIEANPSTMTRLFPDTTDNDKLYVQIYNDVKAIRPMPIFGTPSL